MKILKIILIVILVVIAIPLVVALFVKKDYVVEREISINKPSQEVFDYVKYLRNHDYFSKWASMDPNMKKTYSGTIGQVGFVSAWESEDKEVGVGDRGFILKVLEGKIRSRQHT